MRQVYKQFEQLKFSRKIIQYKAIYAKFEYSI